MDFLDIRTVIFSQLVTDALCVAVLTFLWLQNRKRYAGMFYWVVDFIFQTTAVLLISLRGSITDWVSIGLSTPFVIAGAFMGYLGLEGFVGRSSSQVFNDILLGVLILVNSYFVFVHPDLTARNLIVSLGLLFVCFQCAWLMLLRSGSGLKRTTQVVGWIFALFCVVSLIRIFIILASPQQNNDFFKSGLYDTLILMAYQILLILLTFALALMVNRRLLMQVKTQEEKFNKAFISSPYAILITRLSDGLILDVNRGFEEMLGYPPSESIGKTTLDLRLWVKETDRQQVVAELSASGEVQSREFQFRTKAGLERTGLFYAEILAVENEQLILSSISDVTELKQADEIRRESEGRYRSLFENMLNGFAYCQMVFKGKHPQDFIYLDVNRAFESLTGLKDVVGKRASEVIPGIRESDPQLIATYGRVALTGQPETFETYVEALKMWFAISVYGPKKGFFVAVFDVITERKQAEETLKKSEERYRGLIEHASDGIFIADEAGKYVEVNSSGCAMLGYTRAEILRKSMKDLVHAGELQTKPLRMEDLRAGKVVISERQLVRKDGSLLPVEISGKLLPDGHLQGIVRDITERKRAEDEIAMLARFPDENPNPILRLGEKGMILYANRASQGLLAGWGCSKGEQAPKLWQDIVSEVLASQSFCTVEIPNGERTLLFFAVPIVDANYVNLYGMDITERKQAEEKLCESEDKFKYDFDFSTVGKSITLPNGEIHVNKAFCEMLGYSQEELQNGRWQDITHPEDIELTQREVDSILSGEKESARFNKRYIHKDGSIVWTDISTSLRRDGQAKPLYFMTTLVDITERKRIEEIFNASELRFRTAAESLTDVIYEWDLKDLVDWYGDIDKMMGYPTGEFPRTLTGWAARIHPEDKELVLAAIDSQLKGLAPYNLEYRIRMKNGEWRWWSARGTTIRDEHGEPYRWIGSITDITESKQKENAVRKMQTLLNETQEITKVGGWEYDVTVKRVTWTDEVYRIHGVSKEYDPGNPGQDIKFYTPEDQEKIDEAFACAVQEGIPYDLELQLVNATHQRVWVRTMGKAEKMDGKVVRVSGNIMDITERKQAEEKLQRTLEDLKRSNAELEQFAYVASHDLQEPLRMVSSYVQLLERRYKGKLDKDADEFIGFAVDGAQRMQRLINDLLLYSRVGRRDQPFVPVSCENSLEQAMDNIQLAIRENEAVVTHDPLPEVPGDESQLVQLFQNLIGNSIKFHGKKKPRIHISAEENSTEWVFSVRDNGIGIDPQYAERIFIIFQRLNSREQYAGTGIGLAICKKIILRHGGRIWVETNPGKGATFHFTLPKIRGE